MLFDKDPLEAEKSPGIFLNIATFSPTLAQKRHSFANFYPKYVKICPDLKGGFIYKVYVQTKEMQQNCDTSQ